MSGQLERPLGRGINLQIAVADVEPVLVQVRQFMVADPDVPGTAPRG